MERRDRRDGIADNMPIRRGIRVEVETIEPAEFDLASHQLGEEFLGRAARNLANVPVSGRDVVEGPVRIRNMDGFDIAFLLHRSDHRLIVTIGRVWPEEKRARMRSLSQQAEMVAMPRGATGI